MRIGSENENIEFEDLSDPYESSPYGFQFRLKVTLNIQDFHGLYDWIYVDEGEVKNFLKSLKLLDKSRQGAAKICSVNPDELLFEIRSIDSLGHMEVAIQLHRYYFDDLYHRPVYLKGTFEVEPGAVSQLISFFRKLGRR